MLCLMLRNSYELPSINQLSNTEALQPTLAFELTLLAYSLPLRPQMLIG